MAGETGPPHTFVAVHVDDGRETPLGVVQLDEAGMIAVIGAAPAADGSERLARAIRAANQQKIMHIDVPPEDDEQEFALESEIVERGDPEFGAALRDYLRTSYGIELRPE